MTEGEVIKLKYTNILEKAFGDFFKGQNKKILEAYSGEINLFMSRIESIINSDRPRAERILKDVYRRLYADYGAYQYRELNGNTVGFNPSTLEIIRAINIDAEEQSKKISETSKAKIKAIGKNAIDKGLTIEETTKEIQKNIGGLVKWRARRIARFECISQANKASLSGAKQVDGLIKKYWIYTHDKRVRPSHKKAGQKYDRNHPIEINEKFRVGKTQLLYPVDPDGSKEEIFNCRCTIGYVRKEN